MWGNIQGWIISGVMLLGAGGLLYVMALPASESQPLGQVKGAYTPIALPQDPGRLNIPNGTHDCDAAELYRQAIDEYQKAPNLYQAAARTDAANLPAVQLIVQAADCSRMHLFDVNVQQVINYDDHKPWIVALAALAQATSDAGLRLRDDNPREARKYYQAAFLLGQRLYNEGVAWPELNQALSIMSMAAGGLASVAEKAKDPGRAEELKKFQEQTDAYHQQLQDQIASPLGNPVESYASKYAGDIFAVAKNPDAPQVWRVEAILHLGRYRWNVSDARAADQQWAPKELDKLATSPDPRNSQPAIRAAIRAAQHLTLDQQQRTGGGS